MFLNLWNIHLFESFSHVHFQLNSYKKWKLGDMIGINFEEKWKLLQVSIFIFAKVSPLSLCWFNLNCSYKKPLSFHAICLLYFS